MKPKLLIVEDDEEIRTQMKWALGAHHEILLAWDRPTALAVIKKDEPDVVLLDLGLPPSPAEPAEGLLALVEILALRANTKIIVLSGQSEKTVALQAIREGAYDFVSKPADADELEVILKRAFYLARLERENQELQQVEGINVEFESMQGSSPQVQQIFSDIRRIAATEVPILVLGESGTGKEMSARAVHARSSRKDGPFIAINCGAIPANLLESELFGHERGAFTDAHAQRIGRFEQASGGTLFLDEVGELPSELQVKLLRVLQEHCLERVGGSETINLNTRIIAATNADLEKGLKDGTFREDLYYRLAVLELKLPPLREREGDVLLLARLALDRFAVEHGRNLKGFTPSAEQAMLDYPWPGNIRELINRIQRAVIMSKGKSLGIEDLNLRTSSAGSRRKVTLKEARDDAERQVIQEALLRNKGKISRTAVDLGVSRPTVYELMSRLGIPKEG
jgi:two-component system NtrC family response regulator